MPRGHKSKLRAREKHRQNRAEKQGDKSAQAPRGEADFFFSSILGDGPSTSTGAGALQASPGAPASTSASAGALGEISVKPKGQGEESKTSQVSISTGAGALQAPASAPASTSAAAGASGEISVKPKGQGEESKTSQVSISTGAGALQAPASAPASTSAAAGAAGEISVKPKGQGQKSKKASQGSISTGAGALQAPASAPASTSAAAGAAGEISVKPKGQGQKSKKASQGSISTGAGALQAPPGGPATTSAAAGASGERSAVKAKGQAQKGKTSSKASTSAERSGQDILSKKANLLVHYLLCQYKKKEPIKKGDMLRIIHKWFRKDFPEILRRASERVDRFFGLQLEEVKPHGNYYILIDGEDDNVSRGFRFPIKGILMPILGFILLNDNCAPEEEIWEFLNMMSIYDGKTHFIFGEPRKLITQDLVQEKYLVYQPVPNSDPPRYEFLWGPRSQAETSKKKILDFFFLLNNNIRSTLASHFERALKEENGRAQDAPSAATPPEASGCSGAASN